MSFNEVQLRNYFTNKPVELVYLLGSYATGETKPYSDIDFAVSFSSHLSQKEKFSLRLRLISDVSSLLETDTIDLIDLELASPLLRFEAIKNRREIFVRNENIRVAFEAKVLSEYFDRQYYLKRHVTLGMRMLKEEYGLKT